MKSIELQNSEEGNGLNTIILLTECIKTPPQGGFAESDMFARFRVLNAIEALKADVSELNLEDADFQTAKTCVESMKWAILSKFIYDFCQSFK